MIELFYYSVKNMITNIRNTTSVNKITTINNIIRKRKTINLCLLLKFKKLSRESSSLFVPTTTSFPPSISWIGVRVAGNTRARE